MLSQTFSAVSKSAEWLIVIRDAFRTPMFFFVAGYFFLSSFQSKGMWRFITAKFTRLVIPSMLVLLLLNPSASIHTPLYTGIH